YIGELRNGYRSDECHAGPVVVRLSKTDGEIDHLESSVGPLRQRDGRDLGSVPAPAAAKFLMEVARSARGRAAAKAILPAVLAEPDERRPRDRPVRDAATEMMSAGFRKGSRPVARSGPFGLQRIEDCAHGGGLHFRVFQRALRPRSVIDLVGISAAGIPHE